MNMKQLVSTWFEKWESGDFLNLPISENFTHTSPYGTIKGKKQYLEIVEANKEKFLNHRFKVHDELYSNNKACVRYTAIQGSFTLEGSEWYIPKGDTIGEVIAYYNIEGEKRLSDINN